jgi:ADP-ribosylglycohydrolase
MPVWPMECLLCLPNSPILVPMTSTNITFQQRARGALLGLAVGNAIGTTVEFKPRGSFKPLTDMVGGGPFGLEPGQFTDDTSMALCLAASLIDNGFDLADQMARYTRWANEGYMSSNGRCFDIGIATRAALQRFQRNGDPLAGSTDPYSAGNGCLMRLAPCPFGMPTIQSWPSVAAKNKPRRLTRHRNALPPTVFWEKSWCAPYRPKCPQSILPCSPMSVTRRR